MTEKITLLGTGLMGFPMSVNLLKAGYDLTVWNRSADKAAGLANHGATVADSAKAAVSGADVVISMLSDGPTVIALQNSVLADLKPGAVWIDMSSTKPGESKSQAATLTAHNIAHIDAPVSGGTKGAEAASLAIMAGGDADTFARVTPILSAMGRPVHVGPTGSGQLSKLANQTIVAITIGAVAEAMLLAEQGGADPAALRRALAGGFADSVILQQHGTRMTEGNFVPGGLSKFQLKDLNNVMAEAEGLGLTLPMTESIRDRFAEYIDTMDGGDTDHSGIYLELKRRNGMPT